MSWVAVAESLACPECKRTREALTFAEDGEGRCRSCLREVTFIPLPALTAAAKVVKPKAVAVDSSTCFFHATNQAEHVCDDCGRFLCGVCALPNGPKTVCAKCLTTRTEKDVTHVQSRFIYSSAVLKLALLPLLTWPFTIITAPAAVTLAIIGWKKPLSIVRGGRVGLVIGGILAFCQCIGWGFLFFKLIASFFK